jgi:hypothetical protein
MKSVRTLISFGTVILFAMMLSGCGSSVDENKPVSEVTAHAQTLDVSGLRDMAMQYKDAIMANKGEVEKLADKLKAMPATEMLGEEAKAIKNEMDDLTNSLTALQQRFQIYFDQLKSQDGDLTGLDL